MSSSVAASAAVPLSPTSSSSSDEEGGNGVRKIAPLGTAKLARPKTNEAIRAAIDTHEAKAGFKIRIMAKVQAIAKKHEVSLEEANGLFFQRARAATGMDLLLEPGHTSAIRSPFQAGVSVNAEADRGDGAEATYTKVYVHADTGHTFALDSSIMLLLGNRSTRYAISGRYHKMPDGSPYLYSHPKHTSGTIETFQMMTRGDTWQIKTAKGGRQLANFLHEWAGTLLITSFLHTCHEMLREGENREDMAFMMIFSGSKLKSTNLVKAAMRVYTGGGPGSWDVQTGEDLGLAVYCAMVRAWDEVDDWASAADIIKLPF